jgi:hypothetical protein
MAAKILNSGPQSAETLMSQDEGSCPKNVKLVKA